MLEIIKKRRSVRDYQKKEVEEEKINEILKAAMFAPSAHHRRPWEFVVVQNSETIKKLSEATNWSDFIRKAPLVIVLCANEKYDPCWVEDLSIAGAHIYLETVNQGLGTCWVEIRGGKGRGGKDAEEYVKNMLTIPSSVRVLCLMPIGYPAEKKEEHKESEFETKKIHKEKW